MTGSDRCAKISLGVFAFALAGASLSSPVYAQDAAETSDAQTEETIVVTGYRTANQAAIAAKRNATGIIDAISQDQVGLLPDLTISDVARRIPGLATISQAGPEGVRSVYSEQNVVIRGIDPSYNLTTFDGAPIASSSEDERAANLSIIPPTIVSRIEAVKTLTADLNPHALSGQLNLVTASAFDRAGPFLSTRLSLGDDSTSGEGLEDEKTNMRSGFVYSTPFGPDERLGLVLAGSYETFAYSSFDTRPGAASDTYLFYLPNSASSTRQDFFAASNGFPASRRNQLYLFDTERERASGVAKIEYEPSATTRASIFAAAFFERDEETRHENLEVADPARRPTNQTQLTGSWPTGRVEKGFVYQPQESLTTVVTARLEHDFSEDAAVEIVGSLSRAKVDVLRNMSKFTTAYLADNAFSYDLSSGVPVLSFANVDAANDLTRYTNDYIREINEESEQTLAYLNGAYAFNFEREDRGFGVQIGATLSRTEQSFDRQYLEGDVFDASNALVRAPNYMLSETRGGYDPRIKFYFIDDAKLRAEWIAQGQRITNDRTDDSVQADYTLEESIYAAFGQASYRTDRFSVTAGLRYDATQTDLDYYFRDARLPNTPNDAARFRQAQRSSDYDFVLPSVIGNFDLTEDLRLRAGYGRTIGRPNFSQLATTETIGAPNVNDGTISISRGNADLKPLVSDNFDVSAEYYFDDGRSLLSAAMFYKDIADLIYTRTTVQDGFEFEGAAYRATITQPVNATDSTIYGAEVALRKDFADMLPAPFDGLALDANLTWIDSDFTYVNAQGVTQNPGGWENQPELLGNVQLSYEKGPFGAKVGYNYVDSFLSKILSDNGDIYEMDRAPRGVWDLQVRYNITDGIRLIAEGENLTEESVEYTRSFPGVRDLQAAEVERGRRLWIGVSWTPNLGGE